MITQQELKSMFSYDPDTGLLTRLIRTSSRAEKGGVCGWNNGHGYLSVCINKKSYLIHRLAWLYVFGEFPKNYIDHENGIRDDNRICNLRDVTMAENNKNMRIRKTNTSGIIGVCWDKRDATWLVRISSIYIGVFKDKFEAICARKSAELKYGYHTNHGKVTK